MTALNSPETPLAKGDCYKYEWARHIVRRSLENGLAAVKTRIKSLLASETAMQFNYPINIEDHVTIDLH